MHLPDHPRPHPAPSYASPLAYLNEPVRAVHQPTADPGIGSVENPLTSAQALVRLIEAQGMLSQGLNSLTAHLQNLLRPEIAQEHAQPAAAPVSVASLHAGEILAQADVAQRLAGRIEDLLNRLDTLS
jgi:hypothetical protein